MGLKLWKPGNGKTNQTFITLSIFNFISSYAFDLNANMAVNIVVILLTIGVFFLDWKLLEKYQKATFSKWWILVSPIDLFKRCKALNQGNRLFFIGMGIIILYIVIKTFFTNGTAMLERSACGVVTVIYHNQFHQYAQSCKNVTITQSEGKMHYGFAETSDGLTRDVTITERQGGDTYVTVE